MIFKERGAAWDFVTRLDHQDEIQVQAWHPTLIKFEYWEIRFEIAFDVDGNYAPYKPTAAQTAPLTTGDAIDTTTTLTLIDEPVAAVDTASKGTRFPRGRRNSKKKKAKAGTGLNAKIGLRRRYRS